MMGFGEVLVPGSEANKMVIIYLTQGGENDPIPAVERVHQATAHLI